MAANAPATIVDWVESRPGIRPAGLSEPSKTWVDRMWHAVCDPETSDEAFGELDGRFIAYLTGLDSDEGDLANAMFMFLLDAVADGKWPMCRGCGRPICPHCGEGHREQGH